MNNKILGEISDLMMSAEGSHRSEFASKVDEIIENLIRERETYLAKVILEMERLNIDGQINAVQNAKVVNAAIAELSDSPESVEWNKRFLRSIRVNQHVRDLLFPKQYNMAQEILENPELLMSREQMEYGQKTGREVDLYIPDSQKTANYIEGAERIFKERLGLRLELERPGDLKVQTEDRPEHTYHLLMSEELKPYNGTTPYGIRGEIRSAEKEIPDTLGLKCQGLTRSEFLYYVIYKFVESTENGIDIGILPTLIQGVTFRDAKDRINFFLGAEYTTNKFIFRLIGPMQMTERHILLAKK